MPRRRFDALELGLSDGERVLVEGKAEIYEARGELSFRAATIERIGLGDHLAAIERLKRALAAEGLFAAERKRPPAAVPARRRRGHRRRRGGARRCRDGHPLPLPGSAHRRRRDRACRVRPRGRASPPRSGASRPTRWSTSSSWRAAAGASRISCRSATRPSSARSQPAPCRVVSAVGHEQDTPLCDLAADVRASTPTAAARLVVPDLAELRLGLGRLREGNGRLRAAGAGPRPGAARPRPRAAPGGSTAPARTAACGPRPCGRPPPGPLAARDPRPRLRGRPGRRRRPCARRPRPLPETGSRSSSRRAGSRPRSWRCAQ